ncbi:DUF1697 domain-containing protein [Clostridium sp. WILCCON 0269]|uniref:DUF1697 domain-containing protein n=1 Tax=Candidatus Clostridium eludens TaxID=3381663 RepID=A0ABW8STQ4_9CLOT
MTIYIALLRGINVGGKNSIKMVELKRVFESIGFCEVKTYIQSGNILFKSNEREELVCNRIEQEIEKVFGLSVRVVLRTAEELQLIVKNCPFSKEEILQAELLSQTESLYVAFLSNLPLQEKVECLNTYKSEKDEFRMEGREIFLLCYDSIRKSKIASNLQKLGVSSTVRNWKTINKLVELAKAMEI